MNHEFSVFIISLTSDIERRQKISKTLNDLKIDFEFFDAIDYRSDLFKEKKQTALENNALTAYGEMTDPEMACTLSHLTVYQQIIDSDSKWALILEDDVTFDRRLSDLVHAVTQSSDGLKSGCTYVLGGQQGTSDYQLFGLSLCHTANIGGVRLRKVTYKKHKVTRACCYIIDKRYCQHALQLFNSQGFFLVDDRKILLDNDVINDIYFCDIVTHPIVNTLNSHLEKSRIEKNKGLKVKNRNVVISSLLLMRYKIRVLLGCFY